MRTSARNLLASLLALLLVAGGITAAAAPAAAATGDVAAATLQWGVKESFRTYVSGTFAHGHWITTGNVSDATPFSWTGGTGTANQAGATGSVGYTGSVQFQAHSSGSDYLLDLTISNVRVVQSSPTAAQLIADVRSRSSDDPSTFIETANVAFADLALSGGTATSTATTVGFAGVPATLTAAGAAGFAGFYGAGTALDPVTFSWPVEQAPPPPTPTVVVSKTTNISPAGEIVTVTGTGFGPVGTATNATRPPLSGQFGGVYVAFGKYAEVWKPSAGAPSSARKNLSTAWVVNPANLEGIGGAAAGGVAINADGSFSVQLLVTKDWVEPATGNLGIYTYGGGSSNYAAFETFTPITFSTAPAVKVSKTAGLNPLGETVTVKGWNFGANAPATNATRPPLSGQFGGAYVAFGKYPDVWQPSAGIASSARKNGSVAWVVDAANLAAIGGAAAGGVAINADGTFTATLTASRAYSGEPATGNYGIYTYGGGSSNYVPFETYTPVSFTAATVTTTTLAATPATGIVEGGSTTLTATVSPVAAGSVTFSAGTTALGTVVVDAAGSASLPVAGLAVGDTVFTAAFTPTAPLLVAPSTGSATVTAAAKVIGAGSLTWGIKQSFRDYVSGPIAKGSVSTIGAGTAGGAFRFGQATGGSYTATSGLGSSVYTGAVRFVGHGGILDVTIGSPVITVTSPTAATLSVSVNGGASIPFATLSLAAGSTSTPNNTVAYAGVPATLTAQGARVFAYNGSAFYAAGTALDPVSFVIGSPSTGGASKTIAAFVSPSGPAATPPATTGAAVDGGSELTEGEEYTFTAEGYAANETGVLAVIYSSPTVLATDLVADRAGVVSWTGTLPAGLTGEHTFTFQGSIDTGIVVTIAEKEEAALEGCAVTDGELDWGFKESFRSYISGSIANGEWTVANGAGYETPSFHWVDGAGVYENAEGLVSFTGSITFTGHGGILNTTVADPQVRFDDAGTAHVILDVSGTTQEGEAIDQQDVEFVRLDLAAATVETADGIVTITGAPAVLTAAGATAFGTYPEGEEFDPVTLRFAAEDCAEATAAPVAEEPTEIDPAPASSITDWLLWVLLAVLAIIVAVAIIVIVRRRKSVA